MCADDVSGAASAAVAATQAMNSTAADRVTEPGVREGFATTAKICVPVLCSTNPDRGLRKKLARNIPRQGEFASRAQALRAAIPDGEAKKSRSAKTGNADRRRANSLNTSTKDLSGCNSFQRKTSSLRHDQQQGLTIAFNSQCQQSGFLREQGVKVGK